VNGIHIAFQGVVYILLHYTAITAYFRIKAFSSDSSYSVSLTFGGDGRACFDDVYSHLVQFTGDPEFFFTSQCYTGCLFTVSQGSVQKAYIFE
jgi:hypothetical protein